jgi:putative transposase
LLGFVSGVDVSAWFGTLSPMPRTMRVEYPGAICHVMIRLRRGSDAMNRGDLPSSDYGKASRREDIFVDDVDRQDFLKTLAEACQKTGWQEHAYCLMRNHFHTVLETPNANLVEGMRWFLSAYTIRLNPG